MFHGLRRRKGRRRGGCALKLDMSKAYDRVSWQFLEFILNKMGFSYVWISWMRMCVEHVSYKILVNNAEVGPIVPSRGLRQGDPISPYLFIICGEGLSLLHHKAEAEGRIKGGRAAKNCPSISHLLFADDSLLFFEATMRETQNVKQVLVDYEAASGQRINFSKSSLECSPGLSGDLKLELAAILGVELMERGNQYLGLPSMVGRNRSQFLSFIKTRIWKRVHSWSNRFLSRAGREVLLKSVVQSIPTYAMSLFELPLGLCDEIEKYMNSFWWGSKGDRIGGVHWLSWTRMCGSKKSGSMGFRDLRSFNLSLLSKQGWRLLTEDSALVARIFKAKYYPNCGFLQASAGRHPSFVWRSILSSQEIIKRGARWRVGNGRRINVASDPWVPSQWPYTITDGSRFVEPDMKVCDLMITSEWKWDVGKLMDLCSASDVQAILNIPLSVRNAEDVLVWHFDAKGVFNVKSCYYVALAISGRETVKLQGEVWKGIWTLKTLPKVRDFVWRALQNILPTRENLRKRGMQNVGACIWCGEEESVDHILMVCAKAKEAWRLGDFTEAERSLSFKSFFSQVFSTCGGDRAAFAAAIAWNLWMARNKKVWNDEASQNTELVLKARRECDEVATLCVSLPLLTRRPVVQAPNNSMDQPVDFGQSVRVDRSPFSWSCFVDGASLKVAKISGYGAVFEDEEGRFIRALSGFYEGDFEAKVCEVLALRATLMYIYDHMPLNGCIFLDSQIVERVVNSPNRDLSYFGSIVEDCKQSLGYRRDIAIRWIRRDGNEGAHRLAKASFFHGTSQIWNVVPNCIVNVYNMRN